MLVYSALLIAKHYITGCIEDIGIAPDYSRQWRRLHIMFQILAHDMPIHIGEWSELLLLRFPRIHTIRPMPVQSMYYDALIQHYRVNSAYLDYAVLFENDCCSYSALRIVVAWRVTIVVKDQQRGRWKSRAIWDSAWFFFPSERRLLTC